MVSVKLVTESNMESMEEIDSSWVLIWPSNPSIVSLIAVKDYVGLHSELKRKQIIIVGIMYEVSTESNKISIGVE